MCININCLKLWTYFSPTIDKKIKSQQEIEFFDHYQMKAILPIQKRPILHLT